MRPTITEDELDRALKEFNQEIPVDDAVFERVQQRLTAASVSQLPRPVAIATDTAGSPRRRRSWPLIAAAAVVVALAAVSVPALLGSKALPAASAEATATMKQAASAAATYQDPPVPDGQYREITVHAWWSTESGDSMFLTENLIQTWVPAPTADPETPWVVKRGPTGEMRWVVGAPADTAANGLDPSSIYPSWTRTSECGDFIAGGGCGRSGSWQDPSPKFIAALPDDPSALRAQLFSETRGTPSAVFEAAADALKTGLLPATTRADLYTAISDLPGLTITENEANLDGRIGTALGIDDGTVKHEIIIDPSTGKFIGERQIATDSFGPAPAGTLLSSTSVAESLVAGDDVPTP